MILIHFKASVTRTVFKGRSHSILDPAFVRQVSSTGSALSELHLSGVNPDVNRMFPPPRVDVSAPFALRKQEERVQQVRKKLEEALMADILSRAADTTKDMEVEMDNGDEA